MVYANYTPAKLPTIATELDKCVMAVLNLDSLEIIGKLLYNAACSPSEDKFRRIRLGNEKIRAALVDTPGGVELLLAMGWVKDEEENALVIPAGKFMSMAEVRMIEDQKDRARKHARTAQADAVRSAEAARRAAAAAQQSAQ